MGSRRVAYPFGDTASPWVGPVSTSGRMIRFPPQTPLRGNGLAPSPTDGTDDGAVTAASTVFKLASLVGTERLLVHLSISRERPAMRL